MKKNLLHFFMLMAVAAMPLTSCEKDPQKEDGQHDPESDADQIEITEYDALSWLQGSLVVVDENGDLFRRVYGKALDISIPDVISVPVKDLSAAEKVFLSWVAPDKETKKVDGGYDYPLTDEDGKAQGSVSFRTVEGEAGVVARMSVEPGTDLKHISEVQFIDNDFWPENEDYEKVEAGKIYEMEGCVLTWTWGLFKDTFNDPETTQLPFYCIQGNTDGKEGILVWLSPDSNDDGNILHHPKAGHYTGDAFNYLATVPQANKVLEFYNNNNEFWNKMLKEMDAKGYQWSPQEGRYTTNNSEFLLQEILPYIWPANGIACLDLDAPKGKMGAAATTEYNQYRYMYIRIIPPVN